ncbi:MAG: TlpA disulfide reductase family protein [Deltaproteobacteria bacterium]|nr:TlpA disulfide reductase family protein [Deltaproteobacteria bacterium]
MKERLLALWNSRAIYPLVAIVSGLLVFVVGPWIANRPRPAPPLNLAEIHRDGRVGPDRTSLETLRGKVVLLDFWATWCGPCQRLSPTLRTLQQRYAARGLVVVGVNVDEDGPALVPAFMQRFGVDYLQLAGDRSTQRAWGVQYLPTTVLLDRQGMIRRTSTGDESLESLVRQVEPLL